MSKRLKELEANGLIERVENPATDQVDYIRTQRAIALEPALDALAKWTQCNIEANVALSDVDVSTMMWHMREAIDVDELPNRQVVIRFQFNDPGLEYSTYWALVRPGKLTEICKTIPDFDVDLYIETDKLTLSSILMSRTTIPRELDRGRLYLSGDAKLLRTMDRWLYHRTKGDRDAIMHLA